MNGEAREKWRRVRDRVRVVRDRSTHSTRTTHTQYTDNGHTHTHTHTDTPAPSDCFPRGVSIVFDHVRSDVSACAP